MAKAKSTTVDRSALIGRGLDALERLRAEKKAAKGKPATPTPPKPCEYPGCKAMLMRRAGEQPSAYDRRRFCSRLCAGLALATPKLKAPPTDDLPVRRRPIPDPPYRRPDKVKAVGKAKPAATRPPKPGTAGGPFADLDRVKTTAKPKAVPRMVPDDDVPQDDRELFGAKADRFRSDVTRDGVPVVAYRDGSLRVGFAWLVRPSVAVATGDDMTTALMAVTNASAFHSAELPELVRRAPDVVARARRERKLWREVLACVFRRGMPT